MGDSKAAVESVRRRPAALAQILVHRVAAATQIPADALGLPAERAERRHFSHSPAESDRRSLPAHLVRSDLLPFRRGLVLNVVRGSVLDVA